jgi:pyrroline-5-carboxylate reductase
MAGVVEKSSIRIDNAKDGTGSGPAFLFWAIFGVIDPDSRFFRALGN